MAFVVEDGTGISTANSYGTVDGFNSYHADRGTSPTTAPTNTKIEQALVRASDYIDQRFGFVGVKTFSTNGLEWPRSDAFYPNGDVALMVPVEVVEACYEYALRALSGTLAPDPVYEKEGGVLLSKRTRVGPVETAKTFGRDGSQRTFRAYPGADSKLRCLTHRGRFLNKV